VQQNASNTSWVVRHVWPALHGSKFGRVAVALRDVERAAAREGDRRLGRRDAPLTYASVAPVVAGSRLAQLVHALWQRTDSALTDSALARWARAAAASAQATELSRLVSVSALVVLIAALTHLGMLLAVERYQFPRRTALLLPAFVAIVAALTWRSSDLVARAWSDWRSHTR
jgi:hypothetical protein